MPLTAAEQTRESISDALPAARMMQQVLPFFDQLLDFPVHRAMMLAWSNWLVMHEFGIMQSALETAVQKTRAAEATQILRLKLRVGKLSGVVPEALRFAFDALKTESLAVDAELEIEEVPAVCWCAGCAAEFETADLKYECPRCHQPSGDLRRGQELELASLEVI